ncbi:MAG: WbuC family cupin fold metalloprotein [Lentimicrobium sp.]|nr:WbuC family cupin fold metalloprotein [Lentimicrobium sp.]
MIKINNEIFDRLTAEARTSPRGRKNLNYHSQASDPLQRLLNAMEPGTYVRPHKHEDPDKREVFIAFRGRICVIEFDETGNITDHVVLDWAAGKPAVEIAEKTYHTVISLKTGSVAYEIKDGPYDPDDDKHFAYWAPAEGSLESKPYLEALIQKLRLEVE